MGSDHDIELAVLLTNNGISSLLALGLTLVPYQLFIISIATTIASPTKSSGQSYIWANLLDNPHISESMHMANIKTSQTTFALLHNDHQH